MSYSLYSNKNHSGPSRGLSVFLASLLVILLSVGCSVVKQENLQQPAPEVEEPTVQKVEGVDYFLPKIDLNNWKVTLPIGRPSEVKPPAILNYANNELLQPFMYNDSIDGGLVFYTYPAQSTANSSYSRTELREQMTSGSDRENWTFAQGGKIRGRLKVEEISKDSDGKFHRTIIMQIHGRLTEAQRVAIGEDDYNAPPMLKIYWANNRIRVKTKILKNTSATGDDILPVSAWGDDAGVYFDEYVYNEAFTLEVEVEEGRMSVTLNDKQTLVYEGVHIDKWGVFENYFKAGNYLSTKDEGAFAKVKYYELSVSH